MIVFRRRPDVRRGLLGLGRRLTRRAFDRLDPLVEEGEVRWCLGKGIGTFEKGEIDLPLVVVLARRLFPPVIRDGPWIRCRLLQL